LGDQFQAANEEDKGITMPADVRCSCGVVLRAPSGFDSGRAICPVCRSTINFGPAIPEAAKPAPEPASAKDIPLPVTDFLDPPPPQSEQKPADSPPRPPLAQRMMAALLDPRSIQWMMMLGGGLMVLGIIVWLISKGIFQNTLVVASALTLGALAVHISGCLLALKTRYKIAGQALTFLGCVLIPLNLWFYHTHDLMTLEGNLWLGGVACCAIYVATLLLLRDPIFMYAIEGGITLTVVLLLASQGRVTDAGYVSLVLMALALISIHAERAFPTEDAPFDRKRFGLPIFWSGHAQLAAALITLLLSQIFTLFVTQERLGAWYDWTWPSNWLSQNYWLAGSLWLLGAYAYFYSDFVVRRIGVYVYLATVCLVAAELTFIGNRLPGEVLIAIPAVTGLLLSLFSLRPVEEDFRFAKNLQPLALLLSALSVIIGVAHHVRATSVYFAEQGWNVQTGWPFVATMLLVTVCMRASAFVFQHRAPRIASDYLFLSAASVLVLLAGILRSLGITEWTHQAPVLMLAPIGYIIAARLWRGQQPERPLAIAAHVGAGIILFHILLDTVRVDKFLVPVEGSPENLWMALVFGLATVFYILAALLRRHGANVYAATACACAVVWQLAGYEHLPRESYTVLYAILGLVVLTISRIAGTELVRTYLASGEQSSALLGRGAAAFHSANALLSLAFLSACLQGLARLSTENAQWPHVTALAITTAAGVIAAILSPSPTWRRIYVAWSIALGCIAFVTFNLVLNLTTWQKVEIFCTASGIVLLIAGYIGRFREENEAEADGVTLALFLGSVLAPSMLLIGTLYYRFYERTISYPDEAGLVLVTVLMLVTGFSWQLKAPTMFGGIGLVAYLLVLVGMLAILPNVAMGVYLAIGGALLFGMGIALSIYRERLLALPTRIQNREGVFRILAWR
jgi:hypothetical protein